MRYAILISALALTACHSGSEAQSSDSPGSGGTRRSYDVAAFDSVSLAGPWRVVFTRGATPSVRAEGEADALDRLKVEVERGELKLGTRSEGWKMIGGGRAGRATIYVTAPNIVAASLGGSGDINIDAASGARFAAAIGGSGNIVIGNMRVEKASFDVAGSGNIRAAGTAGSSKISIAGSGNIDAGQLASRRASVTILGSGNAQARASDAAEITIAGSGDATVRGTTRCAVTRHGSGKAHCGV